MIIVMKGSTPKEQVHDVIRTIEELGYQPHVIWGTQRTVIGAVGDERGKARLHSLEVPSRAWRASSPSSSRTSWPAGSSVADQHGQPCPATARFGTADRGGHRGPVQRGEQRDPLIQTARATKKAGATMLRGGAFKPRTSPYDFQGMGEEGLRMLDEARQETGLGVVTEVMDTRDVELVTSTPMLQIGARNSQNFNLLREVGKFDKPVFLKRGMSMTTIQELLMAAEYVMSEGNYERHPVERGIRTFETATRFTLDLNAVPVLKKLTHLPVIVDPSHGTGHWDYVGPMAKAGIACGADGLMIEVHMRPEIAVSDGILPLKPEVFRHLIRGTRRACGRPML